MSEPLLEQQQQKKNLISKLFMYYSDWQQSFGKQVKLACSFGIVLITLLTIFENHKKMVKASSRSSGHDPRRLVHRD